MDRFDREGEAESELFEPVLYPIGSEAMTWRKTTGGAGGIPAKPDREASKYTAAWDASSDDVLGRYLDDIRRFELLSPDEEQALCWRIFRLRARSFRALYMSPTTLPALLRLRRSVQEGETPLKQIVAQAGTTPSERDACMQRFVQAVTQLQQLAACMQSQRRRLRVFGTPHEARRARRQRYADLWTCWLRTCTSLELQPAAHDALRETMERGENEVLADPARRAAQRTWARLRNQLAQAQSRMLCANLRLVIYVATRFRDRGVPLMDLIQEGNLGLLRAIEKFDPQRGVKFGTYAHWWIRQAISRAVVEQSRTVRVPSYVIDRQNKLRTESLRLWEMLDRPPNTQELSQALGWTLQEVESLRTVSQPLVRLHANAPEDSRNFEDLLEDPQAPMPGQRLEAEQLQQCLTQCLTLLPERQAFILRLRYGFETGQAHSLQEIATVMGLSRERVRQLEKAAFETLRGSPYGGVLADFINVP